MIATCRITLEQLAGFVDDALAADDADAIRAHLARCPACTSFLAGYRGLARTLRLGTDVAADAADDVVARILGRLETLAR
jgi:anti-sigma factor RsiW